MARRLESTRSGRRAACRRSTAPATARRSVPSRSTTRPAEAPAARRERQAPGAPPRSVVVGRAGKGDGRDAVAANQMHAHYRASRPGLTREALDAALLAVDDDMAVVLGLQHESAEVAEVVVP